MHIAMKMYDTCRNAAPMSGGGEFEEKRLFVFENCFIFVLMLNRLLIKETVLRGTVFLCP